MTPTEVLVASIENAFASESHRDYSAWSLTDLRIAAHRQIGQANDRVTRSLTVDEAVALARIYGRWLPAARQRGEWKVESSIRSGLAQILMNVIVPNRDESRLRASELLEQIGNECIYNNDKLGAAIALTNSALAILEMHNATVGQIEKARQMCIKTKQMREKGSVDFAYSQMNLALADRKTVKLSREPDKRMQFKNILRSFDQAYRIFKKHKHLSSKYRAVYHQNILETLNDIIDYETDKVEKRLFPVSIPEGFVFDSSIGLDRVDFVRALRSNPLTLGYGETPDWVPSHKQIVCEVVAEIPEIYSRISKVKEFIKASTKVHDQLQIRLFQTETAVAGEFVTPEIPWDSLEATWESGYIESYFLTACSVLTWSESAPLSPPGKYSVLLGRIYECLLNFRRYWSVDDIGRLLARNPLTFRFASCGFAQLGDWKSAFLALEASRGLVSSKTLDMDPLEYLNCDDSVSWVHITHNPYATYCIMRKDGQFSGIELPALSGAILSAYFVNLTPNKAGPLSGRKIERGRAIKFAEEISQLLKPLSDWLDSNTGSRVALIPGGYYQAFPVWACGSIGESVLDGIRKVYSVPSREIAIRNSGRNRPALDAEPARLRVLDASAVPGSDELKWSSKEGIAIRSIMSPVTDFVEEDATRSSFLNALNSDDIVHFTGHSSADADPIRSHLVTHSGDVSCEEILDRGIKAKLVVLGSCESGLARNFTMQDEMLTIQTAVYYAGANFVIGTSWSIYDPPAFAFTVKFYEHLGSNPNIDASSIYQSYVFAVSWLRKASRSELDVLRKRYGVQANPLAGNEPAFTFYDWAAFGVVGVDLN